MWKVFLIAFLASVNGQIPTFPSFPVNPAPTTNPPVNQWPPNANNPLPDLSWPQPQPQPTQLPSWPQPQPQPTQSPPQRPPLPIWPQPTQPPSQPRPPINLPQRPPSNNNPKWRPGQPDSRCPIQDGDFPTFLPDTTNCRQFFMCSGGMAWSMRCPPSVTGNVIWNQRENACEEVENARC